MAAMATKRGRILLVEDDPDIRDSLRETLDFENHQVQVARDGAEALQLLAGLKDSELPQLILLDLMMPVMDGREFISRKNQDPRIQKIPVVLLTAMGERSFDSSTVSQVIRKPLDLDVLLETVEKHLDPSG